MIEPKPREPCKHQYDYDAQTVIGFLHEYGLTDQFCTNVRETTMIMLYVLKMGGFKHGGGLNFDAKNRRESTDLEDFFIAHIGGMDAYARGLKAAAALLESGVLEDKVTERYSSFDTPLGKKLSSGKATLEEFEAHAKTIGEPAKISGKQELYENIFAEYAYKVYK